MIADGYRGFTEVRLGHAMVPALRSSAPVLGGFVGRVALTGEALSVHDAPSSAHYLSDLDATTHAAPSKPSTPPTSSNTHPQHSTPPRAPHL